jgi:hypothetical protein
MFNDRAKTYFVGRVLFLVRDGLIIVFQGAELEVSCTYSTIEIQRFPEFRVYKKCLFRNLSCAEVRGSGKCPMLKNVPVGKAATATSAPKEVRDVLTEELQRFDEIPSLGGKSIGAGRVPEIENTEQIKPKTSTSDVDLLKAELSDFFDKIETKKEKPAAQEDGRASKKDQSDAGSTRIRKTREKTR